MYERLDNCPSCKESKHKIVQICKDYTVSEESFAIVQCDGCGVKYTNPRPSHEYIGKYYLSENYISHSNKSYNLIGSIYKLVRNYTLTQKRKLIEKKIANGIILDYGCGTGDFLHTMQNNGWIIDGVEASDSIRTQTSIHLAQTIHKDHHVLDDNKYDIITLWHVLEHIHDLNETIQALRKKLKKNGYIIIAVPNADSLDAKHYKEFWAGYDVPRHLYHFNKETLNLILKQNKLKVKEYLGMKWDGYYVSMLSEKYKGSKFYFLKGVWFGLKTHIAGLKNKNHYSSLLFIVNK